MYICNYCNRDCKNNGGLAAHKPYCKLNPNRIKRDVDNFRYARRGIPPWNKGLTKESSEIIKETSNKIKEMYKIGTIRKVQLGKPHTLEEKQKISMKMKNNPNAGGYRIGSGRGKKGWYDNTFFDSQWELAYWIYCKDNNIDIKRNKDYYFYEYKGQKHKYIPDFIVNNELVEIKGVYTELVDIKLKYVNKPIKVLYEKDLKFVFDYILNKYNLKSDEIYKLYDNDKLYNKEVIRLDEELDLNSSSA